MGKSESVKVSRHPSSKNSKIYGYEGNQYSSNMYTNEYSNSAQTSQFTFGPGPDSKISDNGCSGTNSANKSVRKESKVRNMSEKMRKRKVKHKTKKSGMFEKHQRHDSKSSRKSKKSSRKKSARHHTPSLNGYFKGQNKTKMSSKSRNMIHQSG